MAATSLQIQCACLTITINTMITTTTAAVILVVVDRQQHPTPQLLPPPRVTPLFLRKEVAPGSVPRVPALVSRVALHLLRVIGIAAYRRWVLPRGHRRLTIYRRQATMPEARPRPPRLRLLNQRHQTTTTAFQVVAAALHQVCISLCILQDFI